MAIDQRILTVSSDLLSAYESIIDLEQISTIRGPRLAALNRPHWDNVKQTLHALPAVDSAEVELDADIIRVGAQADLSEEQLKQLQAALEALIPWRKGPFELFGISLDAEWRSDLKWQRLEKHLPHLEGARITDIGCNNGYYMYRLAASNPELVLGFDPSERCYFQFALLQHFIRSTSLQYELLGVEHISLFPKFFDLILCLGVVYHQRNPLAALEQMREALRPGGEIIVESISIPGKEAMALCPGERYARMRNVYFIPTAMALVAWMEKSGFKNVELISDEPLTFHEQRQTSFAPFESLEHALDSSDGSKTIEGYPAPRRVAVKATRKP